MAQMARNGDVMRSDRLKQVMQQIDPNFDERNAGFNRFSKFVVEAGQKGVLLVKKMDNGQYEVAPLAWSGHRRRSAPRDRMSPRREDGARRGRSRRAGRGRGGGSRARGGRAPGGPGSPASASREPARTGS